jgi:hypothetical protein
MKGKRSSRLMLNPLHGVDEGEKKQEADAESFSWRL